jgi:Fe-S cluster biogenesis protein NfuA
MSNRNLLLSSGKQTISVTLKVINSSGNAIKNARIFVQLQGACVGCSASSRYRYCIKKRLLHGYVQ